MWTRRGCCLTAGSRLSRRRAPATARPCRARVVLPDGRSWWRLDAPDGLVVLSDGAFRYDTPPAWVHKPTEHDLVAVWPKAAWAKRLGGHAVLSCLVSVQGAVFDCVVAVLRDPGRRELRRRGDRADAAVPDEAGDVPGPADGHAGQYSHRLRHAGRGRRPKDAGRITAPAAMAWPEAPSYADVAAAYPKKAREAHLAGRATVNCDIGSYGALLDCTTITEEPKAKASARPPTTWRASSRRRRWPARASPRQSPAALRLRSRHPGGTRSRRSASRSGLPRPTPTKRRRPSPRSPRPGSTGRCAS